MGYESSIISNSVRSPRRVRGDWVQARNARPFMLDNAGVSSVRDAVIKGRR
jgi:hypothetical protein